ncbi:MAG: ABC transporter permease [Alphaproteobacteria bacterium]|nr:ABC transporter permease [Alphaproteobacteria bacterium]
MPATAVPPPDAHDTFLGFRVTPLTRRRLDLFRRNKLAVWSLWAFVAIFTLSLFAEFLCNDRPLLIRYDGQFYSPIFVAYPETKFGGFFEAEADYRDPFVKELIEEKGWILWPPIRFDYRTINYEMKVPAPSPPSRDNWLGTDDQARDVLARVVYGVRISILFGFSVVIFSSIIGIIAGATQGYWGGRWDLYFQRFMEIWGSVPTLYVIIIIASVFTPNFWILLGIFLLFSWMGLVGLVRTEFIRARNFDYVRAARALGASDWVVMFKHILPNAMVSTMTMMPFMLSGSVTLLSGLDFIGYGLPAGSPSLGELVLQARNNLHAPWLGFTAFFTLGTLLMLLVFIGEGVRDAFDPRKNVA